jgi:uncharacterized protein YuzE
MFNVQLAVDIDAEAAYITLSDKNVAKTVEHSDCVLVDLDDMRVAVGVELLDLDATIPFDELTKKYHVKSDVIETLRLIQPTINKFMLNYRSTKETEPADDSENAFESVH